MLQDAHSLPLSPEVGRRQHAEGLYPLDVVWDGILVDDPGHPLDLERQVRAVLAVLWGARADALDREACGLLNVSNATRVVPSTSGVFRRSPSSLLEKRASGSHLLALILG